ncbi:hypothetical protein [Burkholderia pseudomallei]|uniref:hypothetical protein n=1 Tax=Burkholderia pseudomallei TaxID=28450 RepID=UPI0016054E02|nr:hypothetical protein [Burkholderia pseudomallei]MBF3754677.1 hypothetical protein [Burkholderia pseudomallei]MBO7797158.1 hypothetical protein [Burkholderia pseudomallei]MBO7815353.1 hypothetical protein [Burkholderia pseudomallei]
MPKAIRANSKISAAKLTSIIAELERWRDRELGVKLTWERIEAFSGFTRQAMSRHPKIVSAYQEAKRSLSTPGRRSRSRSQSDERAYFDEIVETLRAEIRRYEALEQVWLQRWQRIAFHCSRRGVNISELDRPLDDPGRSFDSDRERRAVTNRRP